MVQSILEASELHPRTETTASWSVPDGWQQGRGAFGGLVLGVLLRAMRRIEPDESRSIRSLSGEIGAPVLPGDSELTAAVLRRGKGMSYLEARLTQGGEVKARASGAFGGVRGGPTPRVQYTAGERPPFTEVMVAPMAPPVAPVFTQHFEYRPLAPFPFSGASEPVASGFVRPCQAPATLDAVHLIALADAWWPAIFATESAPIATATVAFTMQFLRDPEALAGAEPLFHEAHVAAVRDGFFVEMRQLWSGPDLVALNQQTFAVLG